MKKFITRVIIFCLLITCSCCLVNFIFFSNKLESNGWGNKLLSDKFQYIKDQNYNTLVIGSSKVYRQFNPKLFDETINRTGNVTINSFNLGVEGTFPPETYHFLENLLESEVKPKYIILEVRPIDGEKFKNYHTLRAYYWYNLAKFKQYLSLVANQGTQVARKVYAYVGAVVSLIDRALSIGEGQYFLEKDRIGFVQSNAQANNGFSPFVYGVDYKQPVKEAELAELENGAIKAFSTKGGKLNREHVELLHSLKTQADKKGVKLIFLMSDAQKEWMYRETLPLFEQFSNREKIMIADPKKYPALYQTEYKANPSHLNNVGANLYTQYMAESFVKCM